MFKIVKKIILLTFVFLIMVGAYAFANRMMMLEVFTVRNVEVFGVINSSKAHINEVANALVGKNIFDKSIKLVVVNDEPWVQKVVARRQLPDRISIYVYEEKVLFDYAVAGSCYSYTANDISIKHACGSVKIFADKVLDKTVARNFYNIAKDEDYFRNSIIEIKDYKYNVMAGDSMLMFPYNKDVAVANYNIFKTTLKDRYAVINYVDMTVNDRIFVKGVLSGSSKG